MSAALYIVHIGSMKLVCGSGGCDLIQWRLPKGVAARLHLADFDDCERLQTACGRTLHDPERGVGLPDAIATGHKWCLGCLNKMPADVFEVLNKVLCEDKCSCVRCSSTGKKF